MTIAGIPAVPLQSAALNGDGAARAVARLAGGLCLAATPTFAAMALLASLYGSPMDRFCSAGAGPLSGMVPMYLLMSAFHTPSWLRLIWRRLTSGPRYSAGSTTASGA
jgi:hypothetical protein